MRSENPATVSAHPVKLCGFTTMFLLAAVFLFLLAALPASGVGVGGVFPVAGGSGDQLSPRVEGDIVVWEDRSGPDIDLRAKNLRTGEELEISSASGDQIRPRIADGLVVWEDHRNGPDGDVYAYDLSSGVESAVAAGAALQRRPDTSGGMVVWEEDRGSGWKLYGFTLRTGVSFVVSESAGDKRRPALSGDLVVWENHPGTGRSDILGKRLGDDKEFVVTGDASVYEDTPQVSGDTVVWREEGPANDDVYGKDLATGREFEVCVDPADQHSPDISNRFVVWTDGRGSDADVFGLDLQTGEEFSVAGANSPEDSPAVSGETVVWESQRSSDTNFGDWDVLGSSLNPAPGRPEDLTATGSSGGVTLEWTANREDDFAHYDVYRKNDGAEFEKINAAPLLTPSYADVEAPEGVVSRYEVRAVDAAGQRSAPAEASAAALANTRLTLTAGAASVVFGGGVDLLGNLVFETRNGPKPVSGGEVVLEGSVGSNDFEPVLRAASGPDGGFLFEDVRPGASTDYRVRFAGESARLLPSRSETVRVGVERVPTALTAVGSPPVVNYGAATTVSGRLSSAGVSVGGREVILESRPSGVAGFAEAGRTLTRTDGRYDFAALRPQKHTFYRVRFAGEAGFESSVSQPVGTRVRAVVSTGLSASRLRTGKTVEVFGEVSPAHSGSVVVTIQNNGRVVSRNTVALSTTGLVGTAPLRGSKYRFVYRPSRPGEYTVEVGFTGDGDHLGATGPVRRFVVR